MIATLAYAEACARGAPQATQVADRWHLLKNLAQALQRVLEREYGQLTAAWKAMHPPNPSPEHPEPEATEPDSPAFTPTARQLARLERIKAVGELREQGWGKRRIGRELKLSPQTVVNYLRRAPETYLQPKPRRSQFDAYKSYLERRWHQGCHLAMTLIMTVVAIVWFLLYDPGQGFINQFLKTISFGQLGPYGWLDDKHLALPAIMLLSIWQGVGFQMLIFLAGLQGIPAELYEAARIDGANTWQQFTRVTLPQLRNTTIFVVVTSTIYAFQLFDQIYVMPQRGGPEDATTTMIVRLVIEGFRNQKVGYASAISVVFFLIVLAISLIQRRLVREERQV